MNLQIFTDPDPSGRFSKESFLSKNYPEEYEYIIEYCSKYNIVELPFKEKVYICLNSLVEIPKCQHPDCDKKVKYKNSSIGFLKFCSNKCISSDPSIIELKKSKSLEKYGTTSPGKSEIIKNKIKETNNKKYGGNSPMSSNEIKDKSKTTLHKNWKVDNPSKSKEILDKRVKSFKLNIESFKESYKNTSIEKYGVEHPWMNKNIHDKTIEHFYKSYKERISSVISSDYEFISFEKKISTTLIFYCKKCLKEFNILPYQFYFRINNSSPICTNCFPISQSSSIGQIELYNFIKENYNGEIIENCKQIIKPFEIDIYLPELKVGFEFNGVFWHSDKFKDMNYHLRKSQLSEENKIKLYTIWEDDWVTKRDLCKSFILHKIKKSISIGARKTIIKEVNYNDSKNFLDENHLQGDCKSSVRIGLFYQNELISLMTFSKLRVPLGGLNKKDFWELTRFCNKKYVNIVGGASKLINYFINKHNPICIETYSDNLISTGDLYQKLGFNYQHTSKPGYWYLINGIRSHRYNWRKQKLVKMGFDPNKTEEEIMSELNYPRIYNGGNKKWILNFQS